MDAREEIRIKVVDDRSTSRGLITQALDWMGIKNCDCCTNGEEALRKIAVKPVHLVISDFNLPGLNGLQLLSALRSNKQTQRIGFILLTGSADPAVINNGRQLGMNNYLKKPFAPNALQSCIERVVGPL